MQKESPVERFLPEPARRVRAGDTSTLLITTLLALSVPRAMIMLGKREKERVRERKREREEDPLLQRTVAIPRCILIYAPRRERVPLFPSGEFTAHAA